MKYQTMTLDELIDHVIETRGGNTKREQSLVDIIIEQLLRQRDTEAKIAGLTEEFFGDIE